MPTRTSLEAPLPRPPSTSSPGVPPEPTPSSSNPSTNDLISLSTFQSNEFNVNRLVESLMEGDVLRAKQLGGGFDPTLSIKTLEKAISLLLPLRKFNAIKMTEMERKVVLAERGYRGDVRGAKAGFETVNTQFQTLDTKIGNVGRTAVRIGEQLESIDRLRQRASEAHDLILYYNEFALGDISRLETMRKEGGKEGRGKVALAAKRLMSLAKEVEGLEGAELTRDTIEKYCERFEKDMLRLFDRYYRKGDPKAMAHCAQTLQDFNGGHSCIQIYVNQHDFFISQERVTEAAGGLAGGTIWESLPNPEARAPKAELGLSNLFDEIRITVGQEAQIITAVFPNPAVVMQVFLQRVFAQVIQAYVEALIKTASSSSTLAYLRILHLSHSSITHLIADLKAHDFFRVSLSSALTTSLGTTFGETETLSNANQVVVAGAGGVGVAAVSAMLDSAIDELFTPYLEGMRYLDKEGKSLTELYAGKLLRFTNWHRATNKARPSNTIFDRMVNQLTTAAHQAATSAKEAIPDPALLPTGESSRLGQLMKISGISTLTKDRSGAAGTGEMMYEEGDGELDLGTAEKMLEWHAEAVGRMVELSTTGDVPKNAFVLLKVLADSFGKAYVETALDTSLHQLSIYDSKSEPNLTPMRVIKWVDLIMHLWQRYIGTAITPLAGSSVTVRREMGIFNNHVVVRIEGKVNSIVQSGTEAIMAWLTILLAKQKKSDFKPKNDDTAFAKINTEPCLLCCDFLVKVKEISAACLSGRNGEIFLTEVGVSFHTLLLDHLKRFPISATGGLILKKDLALYQDTISLFNVVPLRDRYEMLRQLGNIFIVQPEILKTYLNESYLGRIENRLLRPFVMQRTDYSDFNRRWWDEIFGGEEIGGVLTGNGTNGTGGTAGGQGKEGKGMMRLGGMMREIGESLGSSFGEDSKERERPGSVSLHGGREFRSP